MVNFLLGGFTMTYYYFDHQIQFTLIWSFNFDLISHNNKSKI